MQMDAPNQLQIEVRADGRALVIAFAGELDLASAAAAQEELDRVADSNIEPLIADLSQFMTLEAGDVILTGTTSGVGPVRPGDTVEIDIEGIGVLRNTVIAEEGDDRWTAGQSQSA